MGPVKSAGIALARIALAGGFIGLGLLGVGLAAMALFLAGPVPQRIVVLVLGLGGIVIASGFVLVVRNRSRGPATPS